MINKLIKRIGLICLGFASLYLVGCFHVPDEDWLLSSNKAETGDVKNDEMDEAFNSLMDGINIISSDWNNVENNESNEISNNDGSENTIEVEETISNEETVDITETTGNEVENEEIKEDNTPEE